MRTVLFTENLQPIAIVELTASEEKIVKHGGVLRLASLPPMDIHPYSIQHDRPIKQPDLPLTKIYGDWIRRDNHVYFILFAHSNLLKPQPALSLSDLSL